MLQRVQGLNKRIETLNIQRTKAEAKVEMLKKQLSQELTEYKSKYGVDLSDKSFATLSSKVKLELDKVTEEITAEYELKEKVVSAIEQGRYEDAYSLLGIEVESEQVEEKSAEEESSLGDFDFNIDGVEEEEPEVAIGEELLGAVEATRKVEIPEDVEDDFGMPTIEDDISVEDELVSSSSKKVTSKPESSSTFVKGQGALDAVESVGVIEDDESDIPSLDDTDWGFGDIISGTQFEV